MFQGIAVIIPPLATNVCLHYMSVTWRRAQGSHPNPSRPTAITYGDWLPLKHRCELLDETSVWEEKKGGEGEESHDHSVRWMKKCVTS